MTAGSSTLEPDLPSDAALTAAFQQPAQAWIKAGHAELAYRKFGAGPDLLFVHGWPLTSATWIPLITRLQRDFACHVVDLPGCGETRWTDDTQIHMPGHAATLALLVDALGLTAYGLVAHDSGGGIARALAATHGDRVFGLVSGNTEIPGRRFPGLGLMRTVGRSAAAQALCRASFRSRAVAASKLGFGGCFTDPGYAAGAFFDRQIAPLGASKAAFTGQLVFVSNFKWHHVDDLAAAHAQLRAPVLLIWGGRDRVFFPLDGAREMLTQFAAGARLEVIERGGLFVHEDHAQTFADLALAFLRPLAG